MTSWPILNGAPGYAPVGGTSLAAPVVAGIAGLLFSANPSLSGTQVEQALEASAIPVSFDVQYGRVDALVALNYLGLNDPQTPSLPVNIQAPQLLLETNGDYNTAPLSSAPEPGQVLLRGQGMWTGSAPLALSSVQWQRCDSSSGTCTTIATSAKYTVQATDAGQSLRLSITMKNGLGSTTAFSAPSLPVGGSAPALPPQNTSEPTISGTPQEDQALTASTGTWSGSPTGYSYQWERCDTSGAACSAIAGAASSTYLLQATDVGSTLRVAVTASSNAGSTVAVSSQTSTVSTAPAPAPAPNPTVQTYTFSGSLNPKNTSRSFPVSVGAGTTHAELSFSKCSSLGLSVYAGSSISASKNGPSVVVLDANLAAGSYTYEVSGGRCSFTLTVTAPGR
jgi:hypothetical protein